MHAFGRWLESTQLSEFSVWLAGTPFSTAVNQNPWTTPLIESAHILAIAGAFSAALMINLRILGVAGRERTMLQIEERYTPWIWWGLAVLVVSGVLFVIAEPAREMLNSWFWLKMGLIIGVALTNLWFQNSVRRHDVRWEASQQSAALKIGAGALIVVWCAIIIMGRWIAYTGVE
jgi:hypothetical protein